MAVIDILKKQLLSRFGDSSDLYNPRWCQCVVDRNNDSINRIKLKELIEKYL